MAMSNARGEMYPFIDLTHNPIKGACWNILHGFGCKYCFIGIKDLGRGKYQGPLVLHEQELKEKYKPGKTYFIGSATDMWHEKVSDDDIGRILSNCELWQRQCPASLEKPEFLFQSKNPERFLRFLGEIPLGSTLATTYETDDEDVYGTTSRAPAPNIRLGIMEEIHRSSFGRDFNLMLSIEPIMKPTHMDRFVDKIVRIPWSLISIGADSCEAIPMEKQPDAFYVTELAEQLTDAGMKVVIKTNCSNLAKNPTSNNFIDVWDSCGWIYHREEEKAKQETQGTFL